MKLILLTSAAAAASLAAASAGAETYSGANAVSLEDVTATIEVRIGGRDVAAVVTDGASTHELALILRNGELAIAGEPRPRNFRIYDEINWRRDHEDALKIYLEDYPKIVLTLPAGTDLSFEDCIVIASGGDLGSALSIGGGLVEATFGDLKSADVAIANSGDVKLGAVDEALHVAIGGSGDFTAVSAGAADFAIGGSGDILVGDIRDNAAFSIGGSGDIRAGDIAGALDASVHGSGDIVADKIARGATLSIAGSGDIDLQRINGPTTVSIAGNGDISIDDGRAENLHVRIAGSGDFDFGGVSTNLDASVVGSGGVAVASNEGSLKRSGRGGEVTVNGRAIDRRGDN